jgi:hypothetical protein
LPGRDERCLEVRGTPPRPRSDVVTLVSLDLPAVKVLFNGLELPTTSGGVRASGSSLSG